MPTSYVLTDVEKDGHLPQKASITTETWRGSYRTNVVAIKVFKGHEGYDKIKAVRQAIGAQALRFSDHPFLTPSAEILQRSRPLETAEAWKYTPLLGRLKGCRGILLDLSVDEQRYHNGVHPQQSPDQPAKVGVYELALCTPLLLFYPDSILPSSKMQPAD